MADALLVLLMNEKKTNNTGAEREKGNMRRRETEEIEITPQQVVPDMSVGKDEW
jgi:hypothetical protein